MHPSLRETHSSTSLAIRGELGWLVNVQRISDLVNWEDWRVIHLATDSVIVVDPDLSGSSQRHYRMIEQN